MIELKIGKFLPDQCPFCNLKIHYQPLEITMYVSLKILSVLFQSNYPNDCEEDHPPKKEPTPMKRMQSSSLIIDLPRLHFLTK